MTIVTGFAIDKADKGNYLLTYEIADMSKAGTEGKIESLTIESEGETLLDAARNTISKNYPSLYFGHATCVILSKEVARNGVIKILDFICRDSETRLNIHLLVSEDKTAGEVLKAKPLAANLLSVELTNMLEEQKRLSKAMEVQTYEFINALGDMGISGTMTSICTREHNNEKAIKLCGTAIFKKDRFLGKIDEEETKTLMFILDKIKGGVIVANVDSENEEGKVSLEIVESNTKIKPIYSDDKISIRVSIETTVFLDEHNAIENYNDEKGLEKVKEAAEKQLRNKIESLINKIQTEFGSDTFGFGNRVYEELPQVWKEKGKEWDNLFRNLEVAVETNIEIKHTSLLSKPIMIGD